MDNVIIVDGVIAVVLIAGAIIGAMRGLIKSLAGLTVLIVALLVSVKLADILADPITDQLTPKIEQTLVKKFTEAVEGNGESGGVAELMEKYGFPEETARSLLEPLEKALKGKSETPGQSLVDRFHDGLDDCLRQIVRGMVHTVILLVSYLLTTLLLKIAVGALDLVFDLPGLSAVNAIGGAVFGLLEAVLIVCALVFAVTSLNIKGLENIPQDKGLIYYFIKFMPFE
ncbi:MAG: CvpA family protein [Oscillospiraceae bacterium]|nr:CvpA family protein [Oscillospiraceae bacterium]